MKFLIDECLSPGLVTVANNCGFEAYHVVHRGWGGLLDPQLLRHLLNEELILVTNNRDDFLDLASGVELHRGLVVILKNVRRDGQMASFPASALMSVSLFVYGTLKRDSARKKHRLLRDARFVDVASMSGTVYDLGPYPGMVREPKNHGRVVGELYEIPDDDAHRALHALDKYEGSEFVRQRAYATLGDGKRRSAWAYVLRESSLQVPLR